MPYDDPDATDPLTLHGVGVETEDDEAMREMASCFIEEYARLGFAAQQVVEIFTREEFAGPALAHRVLGADVIHRLVDEEMAKWGTRPPGRLEVLHGGGGLGLPVID